ncbi:hypothetical protein HDU97_008936 [Phlyctochytrium planicorne]|nr:hypothetical protein HDU97_008936 [Phlyctochytrium planicorne]
MASPYLAFPPVHTSEIISALVEEGQKLTLSAETSHIPNVLVTVAEKDTDPDAIEAATPVVPRTPDLQTVTPLKKLTLLQKLDLFFKNMFSHKENPKNLSLCKDSSLSTI